MTIATPIREPDSLEIAELAAGLSHWAGDRSETQRLAYLIGKLSRTVEAAATATTDEARTDALRAAFTFVRVSDLLVEQSRTPDEPTT